MTSGTAGARTQSSLLGRDDELAELRAALEDARAGHGRLYLIAGEAGIGKTSLVKVFVEDAQHIEARAVWGRCRDDRSGPPFGPWAQALGAIAAQASAPSLVRWLGRGAGDVAWLVPEIVRRLPALPHTRPSEAPDARLRLFDSVLAFLTNVSGEGGLILVLEDLHAADEASLLLLRHVAAGLSHSNIVLIGTYRDAEARSSPHLHRALATIARHGRRMVLAGLAEGEVATLLERVTGESPSAAVVRSLHHVTDGNPFFVREAAAFDDVDAVPEEVHAAIRRRLESVGEATRDALAAAAVLGPDFTLPTLRLATGVTADTLPGITEASGPDRCTFSHVLVRETIYEDIRPSHRAVLHRRAGEAIEALSPDDLFGLAHHFFEAARSGDGAKAVDYCDRAAQSAMTVLAFEEAALQFSRALEALALGPVNEALRFRLLLAMADASRQTRDSAHALDLYRRALKAARAAGAPELFAQAAVRLAAYSEGTVDHTVRSVLEEARAALPQDDSPLLARVLMALAAANPASKMRPRLADDAVGMARRTGDRATLRDLLLDWLRLNEDTDVSARRLDAADELMRLAGDEGDAERRVMALVARAAARFSVGDISGVRDDLETAIREARALRLRSLIWLSTYPMAAVALLEGRLEDAERAIQDPLATAESCHQMWALRRHQGRFDDAADVARHLVPARLATSPQVAHAMIALARAEAGAVEEARREVQRVLGELGDSWGSAAIAGAALVSEVAWTTGETAWAQPAFDVLARWPNTHLSIGMICSLGSSDRYLGQLATLLGRYEDAERHFTSAHKLHERMGSPTWLANGQVDHARMLLAQGDSVRARELITAARQTYHALGMSVHDERAAALVGAPPAGRVERGRMQLEGEYWAIEYGDDMARIRDSKGLRYLARLLANPGQELHALDLVVGEGRVVASTTSRLARAHEQGSMGAGDAGALLDAKAKAAYKRRVMDLQAEIDEAEAYHDAGRMARAQDEMDFIIAELSAAVGLGGRDRKAASDAEKARQSVTRAIKGAIDRVAEAHAALGNHLRTTVRTGVYSSYTPDPRAPLEWKVLTT